MHINDFDYILPEELIAQTPLQDRSASRLLVLNPTTGEIVHEHFKHITDFLQSGDVLVLNDTSVIPARIIGTKEETGATIELLLLKQLQNDIWECLTKKARRVHVGSVISFGDGRLKARCIAEKEEGLRDFKLEYDGILFEILDQLGEMPLPPYIHEKLEDQNRYQTVYNKYKGSAAAPTAGLHFTKPLLRQIEDMGVTLAYITLHVGLGTFRPVQVEQIEDHHMHTEYYQMSAETAAILNKASQDNRRIIAVGTTSLRTLETVMRDYDNFNETSGWSDIFIYPGHVFKAIDGLITNFHLPKSTLLMLVSALAGRTAIMNAYHEAIKEKYRFFSFGDSMFILPQK
ncbi:tRNA preQ1(34) S-adenosylmethionine ribosyltransferase-isomerase QueA [Candidatus Xianfuyuplasma coldseepsis]|uniref:S-adenosylmethionine:tRNA ribosyltransferase-isomerase n=1 Tax=Candidatus Xianfuyuplasma coldseepsis TaxID=2782163 RepID=A0A7L7KTU7_9MOLU|nr:tRNA preQ1(34) S-adenosylmethionine ribosyltransferase-isomerase QueA [Xianfuyuplasma coldseepsis]QMS85849.1 tRNA preQ1(34) S-adenosylmethionine ribosyltransferase-isomerase QueA [Xianfuyuplasma coldseepsis]